MELFKEPVEGGFTTIAASLDTVNDKHKANDREYTKAGCVLKLIFGRVDCVLSRVF